ncbi:hypothetical protein POTOM_004896 [Populus tomentosa]|uniref:Uncharacterized protein n=1 Tax=Populus tomentosa TaxID=118781 RepID=A0A8X8AI68_POPTO|nr:hypothetical protein POTOM_004894 [Populus tomentosa]KAG6788819.1 hypothetical protein POTOM_004896 [Populus tomentosa]
MRHHNHKPSKEVKIFHGPFFHSGVHNEYIASRGVKASKLSKLIGARGVKGLRGTTDPLPPKGYVHVCLGFKNDARRFIVYTKPLSDADFLELLYKSAKEYGFHNEGIMRIAHEAKDFKERMITRVTAKVIRFESVNSLDI